MTLTEKKKKKGGGHKAALAVGRRREGERVRGAAWVTRRYSQGRGKEGKEKGKSGDEGRRGERKKEKMGAARISWSLSTLSGASGRPAPAVSAPGRERKKKTGAEYGHQRKRRKSKMLPRSREEKLGSSDLGRLTPWRRAPCGRRGKGKRSLRSASTVFERKRGKEKGRRSI